jgi:hypothetical protein
MLSRFARMIAVAVLLAPSLAAQAPTQGGASSAPTTVGAKYLLPPQSIIDIVDAPPIPQAIVRSSIGSI